MASDAWAALEIAPWVGAGIQRVDLEGKLRAAVARDPSVCLFRIFDGRVELAETYGESLSSDKLAFCGPRALALRDFLQSVVLQHRIDCDILLGMRIEDRGPDERDVPLFCWHKVRYESNILLPDLDFILQNFYNSDDFTDPFSFLEKKPEAFFVGATTGGILTKERLTARTHERVRAAQFFKDKEGITFEISEVVQCFDADTAQVVQETVPMSPRRRTWHEQMACRYILSLDGNGTSWSRTAVALASNSVLVKYASPYQLFYFHGLNPWEHFIPIRRDQQVVQLISSAERATERDARIASQGTSFFRKYLHREALVSYTAELLRRYCSAIR